MDEKTYVKGKHSRKPHRNLYYSENSKLLAEFTGHLEDRKYRPGSVRKIKDCVKKIMLYMEDNKISDFQSVTNQNILEYRHWLKGKGYSPYSICSYMQNLRKFMDYLEDRGLLFDNPASRLTVSRVPLKLGRVLTEKEVKRLLAAPDISKPRGLRDRAILEALYATGVRREELAKMTIFDIDLTGKTVRVKGKNRKERILPLGKHGTDYIALYLKNARPELIWRDRPPTNALWISRNHQAISDQMITYLVRKHAESAKLSGEVNTHTLRRTCATHLLRNGAHPMMVSTLLGHSCLKTLGHYLKISVPDMMKAHAETNPGR